MAELDESFRAYCSDGRFFEHMVNGLYRVFAKAGDVVIDAGANYGLHAYPMCEVVGPGGRVIAVEALPHLARNLRAAAERGLPQLEVAEVAISDSDGTAVFNHVRNATGYSGLARRETYPFEADIEQFEVPAQRLDNIVADHASVRFVKMDLEGGEYRALLGARSILDASRPIVTFEHGGDTTARESGYVLSDFESLWKDSDYALFDLFGRDGYGAPFANPTVWNFIAVPAEKVADFKSRLPLAIVIASQAAWVAMGQFDSGAPYGGRA